MFSMPSFTINCGSGSRCKMGYLLPMNKVAVLYGEATFIRL